MRNLLLISAAVLAFVPALAASGPNARDLFYEAAVSSDADAEPQWRGLRTSILLRRERKNQDAMLREVSENFAFRSGDSFRLRVEANMDGYLYVFHRSSTGDLRLLFPDEKGKSKTNKVLAYESRLVPGRSGTWFKFDEEPGAERLFLFLSAKPIPELEQMKKGVTKDSMRDLDRLFDKQTPPEFLHFDEADLEDSGDVGATFYIERRTSKRPFLIRRVELEHRGK